MRYRGKTLHFSLMPMPMQQLSFALAEHQTKKRVTRREKFLSDMEQVMPWKRLLDLIEPHYPKGRRGRPPIGLDRMLRLYFVQQWYSLADEAVEDAVSDSMAIRCFVGIDLSCEEAPDATTLLKFRRLLEKHELAPRILEQVNAHLTQRGLLMREGSMVDATIINAPGSTKNKDRKRDPDMHQTRKGKQWVPRHEGSHWCGCQVWAGSQHPLHRSQRIRCGPCPQSAAWAGNGSLHGCRLCGH